MGLKVIWCGGRGALQGQGRGGSGGGDEVMEMEAVYVERGR